MRRIPAVLILLGATAGGCFGQDGPQGGKRVHGDDHAAARAQMVREQIEARGVNDRRVLDAFRRVPRHEFVPSDRRDAAYGDHALPIGHGQTISQPFVVAAMTELAALTPESRVLEVGTGSGYQAAILAELAAKVYSIEVIPALAETAATTLAKLGYDRIELRTGDGYGGWPEASPFDAIVVTAAPITVPPALLEQLVVGGRLVIPVGGDDQVLQVHERTETGVRVRPVFDVRFVPLVHE